MRKELKGTFLVILCAVLWGVSGVTVQFMYSNTSISTSDIVSIRLLISGILLLIYHFIKYKWNTFIILRNSRDLFNVILFGIIGMAGVQYTFFETIKYSNSTTASVLQYLYPVMIIFVLSILNKVVPTSIQMITVVLAILGTFLVATHGNLTSLVISKEALFWGLTSAACMTFYTIQSRNIINKYEISLVNGWGMLFGGLFVCLFLESNIKNIKFNMISLGCIAIIIVFGTILPFAMYLIGVQLIGGVKASALCCVEILTIALLSVAIFNLNLTSVDIIGILCIISTVLLPEMITVGLKNKK